MGGNWCKIYTLDAKLTNEKYNYYHGNISEQVKKVTQSKGNMTSFWHNMYPGCCNPYRSFESSHIRVKVSHIYSNWTFEGSNPVKFRHLWTNPVMSIYILGTNPVKSGLVSIKYVYLPYFKISSKDWLAMKLKSK